MFGGCLGFRFKGPLSLDGCVSGAIAGASRPCCFDFWLQGSMKDCCISATLCYQSNFQEVLGFLFSQVETSAESAPVLSVLRSVFVFGPTHN